MSSLNFSTRCAVFLREERLTLVNSLAYKAPSTFLEVQPCTQNPQPNPQPHSLTSSMSFTRIARPAGSSSTFRLPQFIATEPGAATAPGVGLRCLRQVWKTEVFGLQSAVPPCLGGALKSRRRNALFRRSHPVVCHCFCAISGETRVLRQFRHPSSQPLSARSMCVCDLLRTNCIEQGRRITFP